jgi:hypothetical protein
MIKDIHLASKDVYEITKEEGFNFLAPLLYVIAFVAIMLGLILGGVKRWVWQT